MLIFAGVGRLEGNFLGVGGWGAGVKMGGQHTKVRRGAACFSILPDFRSRQ